jgi:hypothetical protein
MLQHSEDTRRLKPSLSQGVLAGRLLLGGSSSEAPASWAWRLGLKSLSICWM